MQVIYFSSRDGDRDVRRLELTKLSSPLGREVTLLSMHSWFCSCHFVLEAVKHPYFHFVRFHSEEQVFCNLGVTQIPASYLHAGKKIDVFFAEVTVNLGHDQKCLEEVSVSDMMLVIFIYLFYFIAICRQYVSHRQDEHCGSGGGS